MAVGQYGGVVIILMVTLTNIQCSDVNGPFFVECLDHNLMITVILSSETTEPHIEAMDAQGSFSIPRGGDAQCGYTYEVYERLGVAVLQASYFSCYTENKNDMTFTFTFQLSLTDHDEEVVHKIRKTCSPPSWSPREITCAENYMEVSVQSDLPGYMQALKDVELKSVLPKAQDAATSVWQIMFLRPEKPPVVVSLDEAADQGYYFDVTPSRIVFRTAHGQEYSVTGLVSSLEFEDIRPLVFLRRGFSTTVVDLAASCTLEDSVYDDGALIWKTLTMVSPMLSVDTGFQSKNFSIGVEGRRLDPNIAAERGLQLDVGPEIVEVSVPYGAQGGIRKTFELDNEYHEFYAVSLFYEHVFTTDDDALETRLHHVQVMTTPVLSQIVTTNSPPEVSTTTTTSVPIIKGSPQLWKPLKNPVTVAPKLRTTTTGKVATTRRVATTGKVATTRRVATTKAVPTLAQPIRTLGPVKYIRVYARPLGGGRDPMRSQTNW